MGAARAGAATRRHADYPCAGCGAVLSYRPGHDALHCGFCGHTTTLPEATDVPRERSLREALAALAEAPPAEARTTRASRCPSCAAEFTFDPLEHAGECPFCATPIVAHPTDASTRIPPRYLVPFHLDERAAADAFRQWLQRLRFRPAGLSRFARLAGGLRGVYLPYWTYDAKTHTTYHGERGTTYYVTAPMTPVRDRGQISRSRRQARVRWHPVSGTVTRSFDDVLIGATKSLPRMLVDELAPWDMQGLRPYDPRFLSGFRSEVYQVGLDEGFAVACARMEKAIRRDVARDIGGDHQRIHSLTTRHSDVNFKHVLLPVWSASFAYRGKRFQIAVNGQTGQVVGQRPLSWFKVLLASAAALTLASTLVWAFQTFGGAAP